MLSLTILYSLKINGHFRISPKGEGLTWKDIQPYS